MNYALKIKFLDKILTKNWLNKTECIIKKNNFILKEERFLQVLEFNFSKAHIYLNLIIDIKRLLHNRNTIIYKYMNYIIIILLLVSIFFLPRFK